MQTVAQFEGTKAGELRLTTAYACIEPGPGLLRSFTKKLQYMLQLTGFAHVFFEVK